MVRRLSIQVDLFVNLLLMHQPCRLGIFLLLFYLVPFLSKFSEGALPKISSIARRVSFGETE